MNFGKEIQKCPICYNILFHPYRPENCRHIFCWKCILNFHQNSNKCPYCQRDFSKIIKDDNITYWKYQYY